jgi:hypothetical protein
MHLKVFVKLKKTLKTLWAKKPKKTQKKTKKPKKTQKTQKNPLGWVFLKKNGFFPTLPSASCYHMCRPADSVYACIYITKER